MFILTLLFVLVLSNQIATGYKLSGLYGNKYHGYAQGNKLTTSTGKIFNSLSSGCIVLENDHSSSLLCNGSPLPTDSNLVQGSLANGLEYYILPHATPQGRFEAHLAVLSGAIDEFDDQRGMAHLVEHVSYMGSSKRQLLGGTGSRTNAYTDFHTTVFFTACPNSHPQEESTNMLPLALDALVDVMESKVSEHRLQMERNAVLSEASMINSFEYRQETHILSSIHKENRLSTRFPIGKEDQIRKWNLEEVQFFHDLHYRPNNSVLFIVGDIDSMKPTVSPPLLVNRFIKSPDRINPSPIKYVIDTIKQKFDRLKNPIPNYQQILDNRGNYPAFYRGNPKSVPTVNEEKKKIWNVVKQVNVKQLSKYFPPIHHKWSIPDKAVPIIMNELVRLGHLSPNAELPSKSIEDNQSKEDSNNKKSIAINAQLVQSPLTQRIIFHLSSKWPVMPINNIAALAVDLMKKFVLMAMSVRLSIETRQLIHKAEFNMQSWIREGCTISTLDAYSNPDKWKETITEVLLETRRMGQFGLTNSEYVRFKNSIRSEIPQLVMQTQYMEAENMVNSLMESISLGNTYMNSSTYAKISLQLLDSITLEECNQVAYEMFQHITEWGKPSAIDVNDVIAPAGLVVIAPNSTREGEPFVITTEEINEVIANALATPVSPKKDTPVPSTLLPPSIMAFKRAHLKDRTPSKLSLAASSSSEAQGFTNERSNPHINSLHFKLARNGMHINIHQSTNSTQAATGQQVTGLIEPGVSTVRVSISGGRSHEGSKAERGVMVLGCAALQRSGAFAYPIPTINAEAAASSISDSNHAYSSSSSSPTSQNMKSQLFHSLSREEVELFCFDHNLQVECICSEDELILDFSSTSSAAADSLTRLSGLEAIFQVIHLIFSDIVFDEETFDSAKHSLLEENDHISGNLERKCELEIKNKLFLDESKVSNGFQLIPPTNNDIDSLSATVVEKKMKSLLIPEIADVSISADADLQTIKNLTDFYLSSIPQKRYDPLEQQLIHEHQNQNASVGNGINIVSKDNKLTLLLEDNEERAVGYLAGYSPNLWGVLPNGSNLSAAASMVLTNEYDTSPHRQHPLFGHVLMQVYQEIASRKLFQWVREELQLTYDANFKFFGSSKKSPGHFLVAVTSSPNQVQAAVDACRQALERTVQGVSSSSLAGVKEYIKMTRDNSELKRSHWTEWISGAYDATTSATPNSARSRTATNNFKDIDHLHEFDKVLDSITTIDMLVIAHVLYQLNRDAQASVGTSTVNPSSPPAWRSFPTKWTTYSPTARLQFGSKESVGDAMQSIVREAKSLWTDREGTSLIECIGVTKPAQEAQ